MNNDLFLNSVSYKCKLKKKYFRWHVHLKVFLRYIFTLLRSRHLEDESWRCCWMSDKCFQKTEKIRLVGFQKFKVFTGKSKLAQNYFANTTFNLSIDNWVPHSGMLLYLHHRNYKIFFHPAKFDNFKEVKISDFKTVSVSRSNNLLDWKLVV